MSKAIQQLSRDLARGISRRRALWRFVTGLGGLGLLTRKKASAAGVSCFECFEFVYEDCLLEGGVNCVLEAEFAYECCLSSGVCEVLINSTGVGALPVLRHL